jgi:hypothetical protein
MLMMGWMSGETGLGIETGFKLTARPSVPRVSVSQCRKSGAFREAAAKSSNGPPRRPPLNMLCDFGGRKQEAQRNVPDLPATIRLYSSGECIILQPNGVIESFVLRLSFQQTRQFAELGDVLLDDFQGAVQAVIVLTAININFEAPVIALQPMVGVRLAVVGLLGLIHFRSLYERFFRH